MAVEAFASKWAGPFALLKVLAGFFPHPLFKSFDQLIFFILIFYPVHTWNDKLGYYTAFWTRLNDLVFKLLGTAPLADAGQAVGMVAAREDPKPPLRGRRLLEDHLHANAAHLVLACLEGKGFLHLELKSCHADLLVSFPLL